VDKLTGEFKYYLTGANFDGEVQSEPTLSLGGYRGSEISSTAIRNIFDHIASYESESGDTEYRCICIRNETTSEILTDVKIWIESNTSSADTSIEIGIEAPSVQPDGYCQKIQSESIAPIGVDFSSTCVDYSTGLTIGDLEAGEIYFIWIKRIVNSGARPDYDTFTLKVQSTGGSIRYREMRTSNNYDPDISFANEGTSEIRVQSTYSSIGDGFIVKTFNRDDLDGKTLRITWSGEFDHQVSGFSGRTYAYVRVYDGELNPYDDDDWPSVGEDFKGQGVISTIVSKSTDNNNPSTFSESSAEYNISLAQGDYSTCTLVIQLHDAWSQAQITIDVDKWEILDSGEVTYSYDFPSTDAVTAVRSGTTADHGYISDGTAYSSTEDSAYCITDPKTPTERVVLQNGLVRIRSRLESDGIDSGSIDVWIREEEWDGSDSSQDWIYIGRIKPETSVFDSQCPWSRIYTNYSDMNKTIMRFYFNSSTYMDLTLYRGSQGIKMQWSSGVSGYTYLNINDSLRSRFAYCEGGELSQDIQEGWTSGLGHSYSRVGQKITISNRRVQSVGLYLKKYSNPTGDVYYRIRRTSDDSTIAEIRVCDASEVSSSGELYEVSFSSPVHIDEEVYVVAEYSGGDISNYLMVGRTNSSASGGSGDVVTGLFVTYDTSWFENSSVDASYIIRYSTLIDAELESSDGWIELGSNDNPYAITWDDNNEYYIGLSVTDNSYGLRCYVDTTDDNIAYIGLSSGSDLNKPHYLFYSRRVATTLYNSDNAIMYGGARIARDSYASDGYAVKVDSDRGEDSNESGSSGLIFSSGRYGTKITYSNTNIYRIGFSLRKQSGASGDITFTIRRTSDDSVLASSVWGDASSLDTANYTWCEADIGPVTVNEEVRILVEFNGSGSVDARFSSSDVWSSHIYTDYSGGSYTDSALYDAVARIYYGPDYFQWSYMNISSSGNYDIIVRRRSNNYNYAFIHTTGTASPGRVTETFAGNYWWDYLIYIPKKSRSEIGTSSPEDVVYELLNEWDFGIFLSSDEQSYEVLPTFSSQSNDWSITPDEVIALPSVVDYLSSGSIDFFRAAIRDFDNASRNQDADAIPATPANWTTITTKIDAVDTSCLKATSITPGTVSWSVNIPDGYYWAFVRLHAETDGTIYYQIRSDNVGTTYYNLKDTCFQLVDRSDPTPSGQAWSYFEGYFRVEPNTTNTITLNGVAASGSQRYIIDYMDIVPVVAVPFVSSDVTIVPLDDKEINRNRWRNMFDSTSAMGRAEFDYLDVNTGIDMNKKQLLYPVVEKLSSDPTGITGRIYYNTSTKKFRGYNGSSWNDL